MDIAGLVDMSGGPAWFVMEALSEARRRLAAQWLSLPPSEVKKHWDQELGRLHRVLAVSGVRDQHPTAWDVPILGQLTEAFSQQRTSDPATLLAAMLFHYPHELPGIVPLEQVADWLGESYLSFMQTPPPLFRKLGEADAYLRFIGQWLGYLHERVTTRSENNVWQFVGHHALQTTNMIMAYFNYANLRDIMTYRARILEQRLAAMGQALDYQFAPRSPRARIRLGILAAHFTPQTETFATLPLYRHLDRSRFEIVLITLRSVDHPLERFCKGLADLFVTLPPQLPQQVQAIRSADLDILFLATNVTAVTNEVALLAVHRLARVQIAGVCSCVTTGMRNVDYYLSGKMSETPQAPQEQYTERLLMIDGPAHCYDFGTETSHESLPALSRADFGLSSHCVVFASGANFFKILPELDEAWAQILSSVPGSRLLLYPFNENWSPTYHERPFLQRISGALARHGVTADRLLVFSSAPSRAHVLQRLKLADIYLDSFPFAGATSLLDPLSIALPTVEMEGQNFRSRVGAALLRDLKLDEFVVNDQSAYIELAVKLGRNPAFRESAHRRFKEAMSRTPRFLDPRWYAEQAGAILSKTWDAYRLGRKM